MKLTMWLVIAAVLVGAFAAGLDPHGFGSPAGPGWWNV